jgi:hypothetical protein
MVSPLRRPCMSVTGPTEETPCVHAGLSAVAAVTMTTAMRTPTRTARASLVSRRLVTIADPVVGEYPTVVTTKAPLRQVRGRDSPPLLGSG